MLESTSDGYSVGSGITVVGARDEIAESQNLIGLRDVDLVRQIAGPQREAPLSVSALDTDPGVDIPVGFGEQRQCSLEIPRDFVLPQDIRLPEELPTVIDRKRDPSG